MKAYQRQFIEFALEKQVLKFGEFTLKSGRKSPYFFNAGLFNSGRDLARLGRFYAAALMDASIEFDVLFGPAYKGIPIASATAVQLVEQHDVDVPWCFNRKEAKDHGEGGRMVGAPLAGRVVIVDDVISAGTSVNESVEWIRAEGARPVAVLIALDRQERSGNDLQVGARSATQEVAERYGIPVIAIACLDDLLAFLLREGGEWAAHADAVAQYRERYGEVSAG